MRLVFITTVIHSERIQRTWNYVRRIFELSSFLADYSRSSATSIRKPVGAFTLCTSYDKIAYELSLLIYSPLSLPPSPPLSSLPLSILPSFHHFPLLHTPPSIPSSSLYPVPLHLSPTPQPLPPTILPSWNTLVHKNFELERVCLDLEQELYQLRQQAKEK